MSERPEPSDEELVALAESLLQGVGPHLRERESLEEAVRRHRETWLVLYAAAVALNEAEDRVDPE